MATSSIILIRDVGMAASIPLLKRESETRIATSIFLILFFLNRVSERGMATSHPSAYKENERREKDSRPHSSYSSLRVWPLHSLFLLRMWGWPPPFLF